MPTNQKRNQQPSKTNQQRNGTQRPQQENSPQSTENLQQRRAPRRPREDSNQSQVTPQSLTMTLYPANSNQPAMQYQFQLENVRTLEDGQDYDDEPPQGRNNQRQRPRNQQNQQNQPSQQPTIVVVQPLVETGRVVEYTNPGYVQHIHTTTPVHYENCYGCPPATYGYGWYGGGQTYYGGHPYYTWG